MSGAGGQRLTVRVYRGTPIAGRFLDKYLDILESASAHAAGAFMRDCLLRGFAALESDGLAGVAQAPSSADKSVKQPESDNTHQNNNEVAYTNNSYDKSCLKHDGDSEVGQTVQEPAGHKGSGDIAGSGVRGMVSRLGLSSTQGKVDE